MRIAESLPARRLKRMNTTQAFHLVWMLFRAVLVTGIAFMILYPVFIRFVTSLKSASDLIDSTVVYVPKEPSLTSFSVIIKSVNYPVALLKSTGITLLLSGLQLASCTLVAYGFARFQFFAKKFWFAMVVFTLIIPTQVILLPLYIRFQFFNVFELFKFWGPLHGIALTDTMIPFVLMSSTAVAFKNGLYIYLLRQYYINMPLVLEEAAYIDGCGTFKTFLRIMLPGSVPMLITVFLFSFVWQWNDYYYAAVLAPKLPILSMQLLNMKFDQLASVGTDLTLSVMNAPKFLLLIAPLVVLYLFTQQFFTESISRSGIVG